MILELSNGSKLLPVEVGRRGRKLSLACQYDRALVAEFKCMRGAEWVKAEKVWTVTDCRRNWIQIESMQVDPADPTKYRVPAEFARYHAPRLGVKPRRAEAMPHQADMLDAGASLRRGEWAAEQGVGKSLAAIELIEWAFERGFVDWWWVAPLRVLDAVRLELRKWKCAVELILVHYDVLWQALEPRYRCIACGERGVPESRTRKRPRVLVDDEPGDPRTIPRCQACGSETELHESLWRREPDRPAPHGVIFDESSRLKNGGSRRAEAAQHLADAIREEHDGFVICMSGTPAPRDPTDWHSQIEITCPGWLRESSRSHLERRLVIIEQGTTEDGRAFPDVVGWKKDEVEGLYERLRPIVTIHLAKDCLDLPELTKEIVRLPVSEDVQRAAQLIARSSVNAVQALNRLRQLSDGFQYGGVHVCSDCGGDGHHKIDDEYDALECFACGGRGFVDEKDARVERAHGPKDDRLALDLARNEETGRVVVYASYHASVDRVVEVCRAEGWAVLRCDGRGWDWQIGSGREQYWDEQKLLLEMDARERGALQEPLAFVAHPGSGGLGLNLTAAVENIFYSNDFNAESRWQAEKRSHRKGQTRGVRIVDYVHLPTDELVLRNLEAKRALQSVTLGEVLECL